MEDAEKKKRVSTSGVNIIDETVTASTIRSILIIIMILFWPVVLLFVRYWIFAEQFRD